MGPTCLAAFRARIPFEIDPRQPQLPKIAIAIASLRRRSSRPSSAKAGDSFAPEFFAREDVSRSQGVDIGANTCEAPRYTIAP